MFQVGDRVVYGIHGVCDIKDSETQTVDRKKVTYLVLEPLGQPGSRYMVPTHNAVAMGKLKKMLTREELELLPYASLIITSEDGIRFLMDHINGDTYYNIYYPGQNLDRARTQLKLVEDMEKKWDEMSAVIARLTK